ncbi:MraY family glycosyltransferase [Roseicyclus persicicus]|uniref:UDP-phosphate N-acetylglucosaminyl 1-phosphate transferase n=1 Tax=Roseicyclus persicicus TaxID=2650661 RepID=A0A7X6JWL2_9RHOB|nr:glycosyltransferase [Roseibacterium persicicum]NKX44547.1 hypothetical protein [Roseibacterium persicicum]
MPDTDFATTSAALALFALTAGLSALIALVARRSPRLAGRAGDLRTVQTAHHRMTARLGGVAVFAGLLACLWLVPLPAPFSAPALAAATALLFAAGLAEDLGWHIPPRGRLMAAVLAGALVMLWTGVWTPRIGPALLDPAMASGLLGIPITLFAMVGISHAFNLIDGVNGLSAVAALVATLALALIARQSGYPEMEVLAWLFAAVIAGFLALNWPLGLIFLGDAGAYVFGFTLSWLGVMVVLHHPDATAWAMLLTMMWPIADTLHALYRRRRRRRPAMQADRLHLHQMVMRSLEIWRLGKGRRPLANPLTTVILAPFVAVPAATGVWLWDRPLPAFLAFLAYVAAYFAAAAWLARVIGPRRRRVGRRG